MLFAPNPTLQTTAAADAAAAAADVTFRCYKRSKTSLPWQPCEPLNPRPYGQ